MSFFDDYDLQGNDGPPASIPVQTGMSDQGVLPFSGATLDPTQPGSTPFVPALPAGLHAPRPSILSRVHDAITGGAAPSGYESLLSPEEIAKARPSLLNSLIGGPNAMSATDQYKQNLNNIIGMHQLAQGVATQQRYRAVTNYIANKYPPAENETQDQLNRRLQSMYTDMIRLGGDPDMIGKMGEVIKQTASVPKQPARELKYVDLGDRTEVRDPVSGALLGTLPRGLSDDQRAEFGARLAQTAAEQAVLQSEANSRIAQTQSNRFETMNAPLIAGAAKYANVKNAIAQLRQGNFAAFEPAFINYAGAVDQGAQLRGNVIKMIQDVDPSVKGRWDIAMQRMASGTLPPRVIDKMEQMVDAAHAQNRAIFDNRRASMVKQNPLAESFAPTTESIFDIPGIAPGKAAQVNGADKVRNRVPQR